MIVTWVVPCVWYVDYSTSSLKADRSVCSSMAACPILYAVVCVFNIFNIINPKHMSEGTQVGVGGVTGIKKH